jgi:hypothetical protein
MTTKEINNEKKIFQNNFIILSLPFITDDDKGCQKITMLIANSGEMALFTPGEGCNEGGIII